MAARRRGQRVDFALLDAWASGDRDAVEPLFERHFDAIHRFSGSGRKVRAGIEHLVQDAFTAAVEGDTGDGV